MNTPYARTAVSTVVTLPRGASGDLQICGPRGALLGTYADRYLVLKTWVDASTASDPEIREACSAAASFGAMAGIATYTVAFFPHAGTALPSAPGFSTQGRRGNSYES